PGLRRSTITKPILRPHEDHPTARLNAWRNEACRNVRGAYVDFHSANLVRLQVDQVAEARRRAVDEHLRLARTALAIRHCDGERRRAGTDAKPWNVAKDILELGVSQNFDRIAAVAEAEFPPCVEFGREHAIAARSHRSHGVERKHLLQSHIDE